jgi:small-conductance mechanosensitive channel
MRGTMMNQDYLGFLAAALGLRLFSVGATSVTVGTLLMAIILIVGVWSFASLLERSLHRLTHRYEDEPWKFARIHMLSRLLRYGVWVFGTIIGTNYLGIDLSSIVLLGSALAVGLGFGLFRTSSVTVSPACAAMCGKSPCATRGSAATTR